MYSLLHSLGWKWLVWLALGTALFAGQGWSLVAAQEASDATSAILTETTSVAVPTLYMFGRDDCGFCKQQFAWFEEEGIPYEYLNIVTDDEAGALHDAITENLEA